MLEKIVSAWKFGELCDEKDYVDVTLACEDEQIHAHKMLADLVQHISRQTIIKNQNLQKSLLFIVVCEEDSIICEENSNFEENSISNIWVSQSQPLRAKLESA